MTKYICPFCGEDVTNEESGVCPKCGEIFWDDEKNIHPIENKA